MKSLFFYSIICILFLSYWPERISLGQSGKKSLETKNVFYDIANILEAKKQRLFAEAFANQDTVTALINKRTAAPKKVIIIPKIKKIYKVVPIYVPEKDSSLFQEEKDTLEHNLVVVVSPIPVKSKPLTPVKKKRSFIYRLFHHKKYSND